MDLDHFKQVDDQHGHLIGDNIRMTISIGATEMALDDSAYRLLNRLDKALYQAKQDGRNRVVVEVEKAGVLSPVLG